MNLINSQTIRRHETHTSMFCFAPEAQKICFQVQMIMKWEDWCIYAPFMEIDTKQCEK